MSMPGKLQCADGKFRSEIISRNDTDETTTRTAAATRLLKGSSRQTRSDRPSFAPENFIFTIQEVPHGATLRETSALLTRPDPRIGLRSLRYG